MNHGCIAVFFKVTFGPLASPNGGHFSPEKATKKGPQKGQFEEAGRHRIAYMIHGLIPMDLFKIDSNFHRNSCFTEISERNFR